MSDTHYVYALVDPRNSLVMYVGRSKNPKRRFDQHLKESYEGKSDKNRWLRSILSEGDRPEISILEKCTRESIAEREAYWIHRYSVVNPRLTNLVLHPQKPSEAGRKSLVDGEPTMGLVTRFPESLAKEITEWCEAHGISRSQFLRELVEKFLEENTTE